MGGEKWWMGFTRVVLLDTIALEAWERGLNLGQYPRSGRTPEPIIEKIDARVTTIYVSARIDAPQMRS
jgi:hypothetical protein